MSQIRKCREGDFDEIIALLTQLWTDKTVSAAALRPVFDRALISNSKTYMCAVESEKLVGFGSLTIMDNFWPEGSLGYIDELVVDSHFRNKGIGADLLGNLINLARYKGCCKIQLDSLFHRTESHRFYERQGFEKQKFVFVKAL
jgi:glucosamine-phosphate N-acetyltransferase